MNLWLSPQGIWYYRKVTRSFVWTPQGHQEISPHRDKLVAREQVAQLLICVSSRVKTVLPSQNLTQIPCRCFSRYRSKYNLRPILLLSQFP